MFLFLLFQRIQQRTIQRKIRFEHFVCLFFNIFKKWWIYFHWIWKMLHFVCNKASFTFLMFRNTCISSLMNAQNRLKCVCCSREAFSGTVSDFLIIISVGTYHFVSSICSQKHFWVSYTSVNYSFARSHIPIPFSLDFCWILFSFFTVLFSFDFFVLAL